MLGNQPANSNGTLFPINGSLRDIYQSATGKPSAFVQSTIPEKDEVLGERRGLPFAQDTVRVPTVSIYLIFDGTGGSTYQKAFLPSNLKNVTSYYADRIHITGIVGTHDFLVLNFDDRNGKSLHPKSLMCTYDGCILKDHAECVVIEGNTTARHTVAFQQPKLLNLYRKPVNIDTVTFSLQDLDGNKIAYDKLMLVGYVETQHWQF
jgi:hypothetical protein